MKRISIIAVLCLLTSLVAVTGGTRPAGASEGPLTLTVTARGSISFARTLAYGEGLSLHARAQDPSTGCFTLIGSCTNPTGTVDFWSQPGSPWVDDGSKPHTKLSGDNALIPKLSELDPSHTTGEADADGGIYCCLTPGDYTIRGFYVPGNFDPVSDDDFVTVNKFPTEVTLTQSSLSTTVGEPVTFTAQLNRSLNRLADGPTGSVIFEEGTVGNITQYGTAPVGTDGTASITTSLIPGGVHSIRAFYTGDGNYASASETVSHTVTRRAVTDTLTVSATDVTYGSPVTFASTVAPTSATALVPTGDVRVWRCGSFVCPPVSVPAPTQIGTSALNEQSPDDSTFPTSSLPVGSQSFFSEYQGDDVFDGDSSNAVTVNVTKANSTTDLSSSTSTTLTVGQPSTFDAVVSGPNGSPATGTVQFKDGSSDLGAPQPITDNRASLSTTLPAGTHQISVVYGGDGNLFGSSSNALTVIVNKIDTTTVLTQSSTSTALGQPVTFQATITPASGGAPGGAVQFKDGSANLGSPRPVLNGIATLTLSTLAGGNHTIGAVYSGDDAHNSSSSASVSHTVICDNVVTGTQTSLTASPGTTCLNGADVGNVTVPAGSKLSLVNSTVRGTITAKGGAGPITICGTHVGGNVKINGASGFVLVGDPVDDACPANTIDGTVTLSNNAGGLELAFNHIGGRANIKGNHTSSEIEANTFGGNLVCSGNSPAASDDARSNSIGGRGIGECSAPGF